MQKVDRVFSAPIVLSARSIAECRTCDYIATLFAHKKACKVASEGAHNPVEIKSLLDEEQCSLACYVLQDRKHFVEDTELAFIMMINTHV
jgi:hypothetical protein